MNIICKPVLVFLISEKTLSPAGKSQHEHFINIRAMSLPPVYIGIKVVCCLSQQKPEEITNIGQQLGSSNLLYFVKIRFT